MRLVDMHIRVLIRVAEQQRVEFLLVSGNLLVDALGARIDPRRGRARRHRAHLLLGGRAAGDGGVVLGLQGLQLRLGGLQPREVSAAALAGNITDIGFLEIREFLLRLGQPFAVILDLLVQEILRCRGGGGIRTHGIVHQDLQERLHHLLRHLPVVVAVAEVVEVLRASVLDADGGAQLQQQRILVRGRSRTQRQAGFVRHCLEIGTREQRVGDYLQSLADVWLHRNPFNSGFVNASVSAYTWAVASYLFGRLKTSRDPTIITPHATINARQR